MTKSQLAEMAVPVPISEDELTENVMDRFFGKIHITPLCWLWQGYTNDRGYGQFFIDKSKSRKAHRVSYTYLNGAIPHGLTIDHICKVTSCVNPLHLRPMPLSENARQGQGSKKFCGQGHPFDGENLLVYKGLRYCVICKSNWRKAHYERNKERVNKKARERYRSLKLGEVQNAMGK